MKDSKPIKTVDVVSHTPKKRGLLRKVRDEFERDTDGMSLLDRMKTRALGNKEVQRGAVEAVKVAMQHELEAYVEHKALESYERRVNHSITKEQIYEQFVEATQDSRKQATENLLNYIGEVFKDSQIMLVQLFDSRKAILEEYDERLASGAIDQDEYNKLTKRVKEKADSIFIKLDDAIETFYEENLSAFKQNMENFSARYNDKQIDF